jgi:hypothetical protein
LVGSVLGGGGVPEVVAVTSICRKPAAIRDRRFDMGGNPNQLLPGPTEKMSAEEKARYERIIGGEPLGLRILKAAVFILVAGGLSGVLRSSATSKQIQDGLGEFIRAMLPLAVGLAAVAVLAAAAISLVRGWRRRMRMDLLAEVVREIQVNLLWLKGEVDEEKTRLEALDARARAELARHRADHLEGVIKESLSRYSSELGQVHAFNRQLQEVIQRWSWDQARARYVK